MKASALFMGSKRIGLRILKTMAATSPGSVAGAVTIDDGTDSRSVLGEFQTLCAELGLDLEVLDSPSQLETAVRRFSPTTVVVAGWYWLIPPGVLSLARDGFVGLHASLLPRMRGSAPVVWAILTAQKESGVSLFYLDEGVDSGDLIGQTPVQIGESDYVSDVLDRIESVSVSLLEEHFLDILVGSAGRTRQEEGSATYCSIRRPIDGHIDWSSSSEAVYNFVRAQSWPYPGAFAYLGTSKVVIWRTDRFPRPLVGVPGVVSLVGPDGPVVATSEGAVILVDYEIEDRRTHPHLKFGQRLS